VNGHITVVGLACSGILIALAVAISWWRRLALEGMIGWAAVRAVVQLTIIGFALKLVVDPDRPLIWSWLWVVVMLVFAGTTARRRAREVPGVAALTMTAYALALVVTFAVLFGLRVFDLNGRTVVPLAGMIVGNSIGATVLVGRRITDEFRDKRPEIEARLALGLTGHEAARPYLRNAVRTALIPQVETTKAVGIVFLPGAMVGLILAGADPLAAVRVQVAVMYLILGSVAVTTTVVALGLQQRLVTADHRLVRLAAPAAKRN
jgi:putative ABC transport system permease protein